MPSLHFYIVYTAKWHIGFHFNFKKAGVWGDLAKAGKLLVWGEGHRLCWETRSELYYTPEVRFGLSELTLVNLCFVTVEIPRVLELMVTIQ